MKYPRHDFTFNLLDVEKFDNLGAGLQSQMVSHQQIAKSPSAITWDPYVPHKKITVDLTANLKKGKLQVFQTLGSGTEVMRYHLNY